MLNLRVPQSKRKGTYLLRAESIDLCGAPHAIPSAVAGVRRFSTGRSQLVRHISTEIEMCALRPDEEIMSFGDRLNFVLLETVFL